jgi:V/A-type H+/Na+-transporting ATPase subunit B
LDLGWSILADCFDPEETGVPSKLIEEYWPKTSPKKESEQEQQDVVEVSAE